jgi:hypothetical protein
LTERWAEAATGERYIHNCFLSIPLENPVDIARYQRLRLNVNRARQAAGIPIFINLVEGDNLFVILSRDCDRKASVGDRLQHFLREQSRDSSVKVNIVESQQAHSVIAAISDSEN